MPYIDILLFTFGFGIIATSSHLLVSLLEDLTSRLKVSRFKFSMILLGLLTSVPELSIGINAAIENRPEIYIGNLLGGTVILFLWIIPFLAIFGKGIKIEHGLSMAELLWAVLVILLPVILILDHNLSLADSIILILAYVLKILISKNQSTLTIASHKDNKLLVYGVFISVVFISSIFLSSHIVVERAISIATELNVPSYYIGLFILTLGTNLPEFTIAVNAIRSGRKELAFGDYIGSALANVLIFGICGLISVNTYVDFGNYRLTSYFLLVSLALFYLFIKSKRELNQKEGFVLISLFLAFAIVQVLVN